MKYTSVKYAVAPGELKVTSTNTGVEDQDLKRVSVLNAYSIYGAQSLPLTNIDVGNSNSTRVGNKIFCEYIEVRGECENIDTTEGYPHTFRIIFFVDHQSNGAESTTGQLLDVTACPPKSAVYAQRQLSYRDRFTVLKDVTISLAAAGSTAAHAPFHFFVPCKFNTTYNGSGSAIDNVMTNAVYISVLADAVEASKVVWCCQARLRYRDI